MNTTPKRNRSKSKQVCEDVEEEFSRRFLRLFSSFYDIPSTDPLKNFPPVAKSSQKNEVSVSRSNVSQPPFQAAVWDMRLKKAVETYNNIKNECSDNIDNEFANIEQLIEDQGDEKIIDAFEAERAERPDVPKYLQTLRTEFGNTFRRKKFAPSSLNIQEAERQFAQRQQKQKLRSKEHKKKLQEQHAQREKEHMDFLKTLPKTKASEVKTPTARDEFEARNKRARELLKRRKEGVSSTMKLQKQKKETPTEKKIIRKGENPPSYYNNNE